MPYFSIVIPCFNAAETLNDTLDSIASQTFVDWEALIIDDGSTDATWALAVARTAKDSRFKVMRNSGQGPSSARNHAAMRSRGKVIAFCDADDLWDPQKLALMHQTFARPDVDGVYARVAFFDGKGSRSTSRVCDGPLSVQTLLGENPVCTMSNVAVTRRTFMESGGFDVSMVHNEDLEWLIRVTGSGGRFLGLDEILVRYRTSPTGLSANLDAMRVGRETALATAARMGFPVDRRSEAIHLRYIARRALRTDAPPLQSLRMALAGVATSPVGFFTDIKRGGLTFLAALAAPIMPRRLRRSLFSN